MLLGGDIGSFASRSLVSCLTAPTMEILVFKTDLTQSRLVLVGKVLADLPGLLRWNVDLEDCDRVLRLEADPALSIETVKRRLRATGIFCDELC